MERLRALLEGLECKKIDDLLQQTDPEVFRAIGKAIAAIANINMDWIQSYMTENTEEK